MRTKMERSKITSNFMLVDRFNNREFWYIFVCKLVCLVIGAIQQISTISSNVAELEYIEKP